MASDLDTLAKIHTMPTLHISSISSFETNKYETLSRRGPLYLILNRHNINDELFVRSRRLGSLKVLPGRTGTSEARVKKPSLAGGHWQRVGRAAFLCAGAATHSHAYTQPLTMCRRATARTLRPIRRRRSQPAPIARILTRSLIHGRPCHGFRSPPALLALIQIRIVFARSRPSCRLTQCITTSTYYAHI